MRISRTDAAAVFLTAATAWLTWAALAPAQDDLDRPAVIAPPTGPADGAIVMPDEVFGVVEEGEVEVMEGDVLDPTFREIPAPDDLAPAQAADEVPGADRVETVLRATYRLPAGRAAAVAAFLKAHAHDGVDVTLRPAPARRADAGGETLAEVDLTEFPPPTAREPAAPRRFAEVVVVAVPEAQRAIGAFLSLVVRGDEVDADDMPPVRVDRLTPTSDESFRSLPPRHPGARPSGGGPVNRGGFPAGSDFGDEFTEDEFTDPPGEPVLEFDDGGDFSWDPPAAPGGGFGDDPFGGAADAFAGEPDQFGAAPGGFGVAE